jgi:hypothetical protein
MLPIGKDATATYWYVRTAVFLIGLLFPVILVVGGFLEGVAVPDSFSAYYHATTAGYAPPAGVVGLGALRNEFVGLLFAVGICMYLYKGFSELEDWLLNLAGIFAVGVALIPMPWPPGSGSGLSWHYVSAVSFFVCLGIVCTFCSETTLRAMPPDTPPDVIKMYRAWYRTLSALMITSPIVALVLRELNYRRYVLVLELIGIWAFSAYWLVKTKEMKQSELEGRLLKLEAKKAAMV